MTLAEVREVSYGQPSLRGLLQLAMSALLPLDLVLPLSPGTPARYIIHMCVCMYVCMYVCVCVYLHA